MNFEDELSGAPGRGAEFTFQRTYSFGNAVPEVIIDSCVRHIQEESTAVVGGNEKTLDSRGTKRHLELRGIDGKIVLTLRYDRPPTRSLDPRQSEEESLSDPESVGSKIVGDVISVLNGLDLFIMGHEYEASEDE